MAANVKEHKDEPGSVPSPGVEPDTKLDDLDLSRIKKDHLQNDPEVVGKVSIKIKEIFLKGRDQTGTESNSIQISYGNLVSCYRDGNVLSTPFGNFDCSFISAGSAQKIIFKVLCMAFFPLSILLQLIPEKEDETLIINEVVVAHVVGKNFIFDVPTSGNKGRLKINHLVILHQNPNNEAIKELLQLNSNQIELTKTVSGKLGSNCEIKNCQLEELYIPLDSLSPVDDFKALFNKFGSIKQVPKETSPHVMFARFHKTPASPPSGYKEKYADFNQGNVLVATLGNGYDRNTTINDKVLDDGKWSHDNEGAPPDHHHGFTVHNVIDEYANNAARFAVCRTTNEIGIIVAGATANAIKWLRRKWGQDWKGNNYKHLIVLIPYGGQYMEDEMIEITKATDEGIIIVCAAGDCREGGGGGDVVFPAALGICLSVGVAEVGPKGREIDIALKFKLPAWQDDLGCNCGTAAAMVAGMLCLLLSRITLEEPVNSYVQRKHYSHTCVIRELLVNEGKGSHDPQLGYGDGKRIIQSLLDMENSSVLQKIANIFLRDRFRMDQTNTQQYKPIMVKEEERKKTFYNLKGDGTTIIVIDQFDVKEPINRDKIISMEDILFTIFQSPQPHTHGVKCATILKTVSPKASIWCANTKSDHDEGMEHYFKECIAKVRNIDIISLSLSNQSFRLEKCQPVNEAVIAGKIIVFAAGNAGQSQRNTIEYPGRIGNVIVVGGRDLHHNRVEYSPVGREMDFLAEARQLEGGTSYAAPVVAGYIALLLQFIKEKMEGDKVSAWSKSENLEENLDAGVGEYQWRNISVFKAAHNVYAMRALLRQLLVPKPQLHVHSETEGFGCLDFSMLFPYYHDDACRDFVAQEAKLKIKNTLQKFYKRH